MSKPASKKEENRREALPGSLSRDEAARMGRSFREKMPRVQHAEWKALPNRKSPIDHLKDTLKNYLPHLLPIRYGRMLQSPFSFFRGAASIMAADLSETPDSGIHVQSCGDCHLLNFGSFATPERKIVFDLNDFDETLPAPWEWDLKRLATSFIIASRHNDIPRDATAQIVENCVDSYRSHTEVFAAKSPLEVWYESITSKDLFESSQNEEAKKRYARQIEQAKEKFEKGEDFPNMTELVAGELRIRDQPPLIYHQKETADDKQVEIIKHTYNQYIESLSEEKRTLLRQYHYQDIAAKVVGIGSVGKVCGILLLLSADNEPLFLQVKEARASVLEPFTQEAKHQNDGERIVVGQKLMQSASDLFLGWCEGPDGRHFYIRQLRDMKIKPPVEVFDARSMNSYAKLCGWALARAHARSGKSALIAGYIGKSNKFQKAISQFSLEYARQNEADFRALKQAVSDGKIEAFTE